MLQQIANDTDADYYHAPTSSQLEDIYSQISSRICQYGSISGCKYSDSDKDGDEVDFSGEDTISNWEIILTGGANGPSVQLTDDNGCYIFSGLLSGTYDISEGGKVGVDNFEQTYPVGDSYTNIILSDSDNLENYDFGNYLPVCDNGILDENYFSYKEECDGILGVGAHQICSDSCALVDLTYCGDGILQAPNDEGTGGPQDDGNEQCDDGLVGSETCTSQCNLVVTEPFCGDGEIDIGEDCDDGNNSDGDGCSSVCQIETTPPDPVCGNGFIEDGEQCDDGNIEDGDGCSATCQTEARVYQCSDDQDNDGDGFIDYPSDLGCDSSEDDDEYNAYCGDGVCNASENCSVCSQDCGSCGGGGTIITIPAIIITNEKVSYLGDEKAEVTWTTNIETTEQVAYGDNSISTLGSVPEYGYDSVNDESSFMTKE
ncbi:MAG: DUF4215 domain-containing protein, partial [Candidatus Pacebacteria bacterium]|nr:DUF4215 domain-containing protein [Candidatus Paceibacterota bacterium]